MNFFASKHGFFKEKQETTSKTASTPQKMPKNDIFGKNHKIMTFMTVLFLSDEKHDFMTFMIFMICLQIQFPNIKS